MSVKVKFIGLWPRIVAFLIDVGLFALLTRSALILADKFIGTNPLILFFVYLSVPFAFFFYNIVFHAVCGQTIGKMIMRIKLYTSNFRQIDLKHAVLRDSIAISLQVLSFFGILMALQQLPSEYVSPAVLKWPADYVVKILMAAQSRNPLASFLQVSYLVWILVIFFTILRNKYKRSINDKIAGTVLVKINY